MHRSSAPTPSLPQPPRKKQIVETSVSNSQISLVSMNQTNIVQNTHSNISMIMQQQQQFQQSLLQQQMEFQKLLLGFMNKQWFVSKITKSGKTNGFLCRKISENLKNWSFLPRKKERYFDKYYQKNSWRGCCIIKKPR